MYECSFSAQEKNGDRKTIVVFVCCWCVQLLCLARVILSTSKVVIIDEVMTVVNEDTEQILHRVVRTAFNDRTVINLSVKIHTTLPQTPMEAPARYRGGGGQIFKEFIGRTSVKFWMGGTLDKFNTNLGQSWERIGKINQVILNNNNNLASCSRVQYADTRPLVSKFAGNLHLHNMYNQHNRRAMVNYIQILPWYYIFVHQEAYVLFRLVPAQRKYPLSEYLCNISVT